MRSDISFVPNTEDDNTYIHNMLRRYNRQYACEFKDYSFHIMDAGKIVAGIVAGSTFDTLEVEFLFVNEEYRRKGLGRELIHHMEELASQDGIRRILLNTYSFQAPDFYARLGYKHLFEINPCFGEYSQYFFIKQL